ncbi:beta-propeller fold lactonase family protein [Streptomyces sp. SID3343]|uniref:beta-propeller fold lactonase family protein n=1 Tax=Streptomyces sp. SID3343 TaxID=2690260 RepID=UPI00136E5A72|nr:beta-propeller fold lactonase family protein [Streptomyces sp. SID3343]
MPPSRALLLVGGEQVQVCAADPATGTLTRTGPRAPVYTAYAAVHPRLGRRRVYGVDEAPTGTLTVFDAGRAGVAVLEQVGSQGSVPCHVAVSPDGRYVLVANYGSGDVLVYRLDESGALAGVSDRVRLPGSGSGVHPQRQSAPHPHQIVFTAHDTLTVVDLGGDALPTYRLDAGRLRLLHTHPVPAGTGPRHLSGRWVLGELDPVVLALPAHTRHPLAAPGLPSAIVTSPDGAHVYAANRGPGTITALATTAPHAMSEVAAGGADPQDLAFVGDLLYAAVPDADAVTAFRRMPDGRLLALGPALHVPDPRCVLPLA